MNIKISLGLMLGVAAVLILIPDALPAMEQATKKTSSFWASDKATEFGTMLGEYLFSIIGRIVVTAAGAFASMKAMFAHNFGLLATFAAVTLGFNFVPHFINGVFSILLP